MKISGRIGLYLLLGALYLLITPNITLACTCDLPKSGATLRQRVNEARKQAKAVFVGRVMEVVSDPHNLYVDVKFQVERSWKREPITQVIVRTGRGGGDCGYHFEVGESYLVYAYRSNEGTLETNICQRTTSLTDAKDDLRLLGRTKSHPKK